MASEDRRELSPPCTGIRYASSFPFTAPRPKLQPLYLPLRKRMRSRVPSWEGPGGRDGQCQPPQGPFTCSGKHWTRAQGLGPPSTWELPVSAVVPWGTLPPSRPDKGRLAFSPYKDSPGPLPPEALKARPLAGRAALRTVTPNTKLKSGRFSAAVQSHQVVHVHRGSGRGAQEGEGTRTLPPVLQAPPNHVTITRGLSAAAPPALAPFRPVSSRRLTSTSTPPPRCWGRERRGEGGRGGGRGRPTLTLPAATPSLSEQINPASASRLVPGSSRTRSPQSAPLLSLPPSRLPFLPGPCHHLTS